MSESGSRKALLSITSCHGVICPDGTKIGRFHPHEVLTKVGFELDLATETGTYGAEARENGC